MPTAAPVAVQSWSVDVTGYKRERHTGNYSSPSFKLGTAGVASRPTRKAEPPEPNMLLSVVWPVASWRLPLPVFALLDACLGGTLMPATSHSSLCLAPTRLTVIQRRPHYVIGDQEYPDRKVATGRCTSDEHMITGTHMLTFSQQ